MSWRDGGGGGMIGGGGRRTCRDPLAQTLSCHWAPDLHCDEMTDCHGSSARQLSVRKGGGGVVVGGAWWGGGHSSKKES